MEQDNQAEEISTDKRRDRNGKGQFEKGNHLGNRFPPGNNANPTGRPKSKAITDSLLVHLEKKAVLLDFTERAARKMGLDPEKVTVRDVLTATFLLNGMKGKGDISKEIWARLEGSIPKVLNLGPTDEFGDYLDAMRAQTQFDNVDEDTPEETEPDADPV